MILFVRDSNFYRRVIKLAVPVVFQSMITMGIGMIGTLMVGQLGEKPLSATSLANEFIILYQILCMGIGYGAAVLTAQYWGQRNISALKKIVTIMLKMCIVVGGILGAIAFLAPEAVMRIFTPDSELIKLGAVYMKISAWTFIPTGLALTVTAVLRSFGEVRIPLYTSIIAFFVNIFFNWVLIFGKLGAPRMEIMGSALGTLISRAFELLFIAGYFFFVDKRVGYRLKEFFTSCKGLYKQYIKFCIPVLISDTILGVGNSAITVIIGHIGFSFVAANAIVSQVTRMATIFTTGVSSASSIITGNTLGEGDTEKAYKEGITFLSLSVALGLVAGVALLILCPFMIRSVHISEEAKGIARQLMYAIAVILVFQSAQTVLTKGVLRGGGDTRFLMAADVLFLWLVSIPLGALAGLVFHLPAFVIYICLRADYIIKSIWCTLRLLKGNWMNNVTSSHIHNRSDRKQAH
jgi:putative MATE family efflux protein